MDLIQKLVEELTLEQKHERKKFCRNIVHSIVISTQSLSIHNLLSHPEPMFSSAVFINSEKYVQVLEEALETEKESHVKAKAELKAAYYQIKVQTEKLGIMEGLINKALKEKRVKLRRVSKELKIFAGENEKLKKQIAETRDVASAAIFDSEMCEKRVSEMQTESDCLKKEVSEIRLTVKRLLSQLCMLRRESEQKMKIRERRSFVYNKK